MDVAVAETGESFSRHQIREKTLSDFPPSRMGDSLYLLWDLST